MSDDARTAHPAAGAWVPYTWPLAGDGDWSVTPAELAALWSGAASVLRERGYDKHGRHPSEDDASAGKVTPVSMAAAIGIAAMALLDGTDREGQEEELARQAGMRMLGFLYLTGQLQAESVIYDPCDAAGQWDDHRPRGEWKAPRGDSPAARVLDAAAALMVTLLPAA